MTGYACSACGPAGCSCAVSTDRLPPPCSVCRRPRAACICRSHVEVRASSGDAEAMEHRDLVEARVHEAMQHYYNRDAAGLERFIRGLP